MSFSDLRPGNRLIGSLSAADLASIEPHLEPVAFRPRQRLCHAQQPISHAYFMDSGLASISTGPEPRGNVEVAMVGREGFCCSSIVLAAGRSPHGCMVEAEGSGWRIAADEFARAVDGSAGLRTVLLGYVQSLMLQISATARANATFSVEERLARLLLICFDRLHGDTMLLTHMRLSSLLGVRRAGVSLAMQKLARQGAIRMSRGSIRLLERALLEGVAGASYRSERGGMDHGAACDGAVHDGSIRSNRDTVISLRRFSS